MFPHLTIMQYRSSMGVYSALISASTDIRALYTRLQEYNIAFIQQFDGTRL